MKHKYFYLISFSYAKGTGVFELRRNKKIDSKTEYLKAKEFVKKESPKYEDMFFTNIIELKNI